MSYPNSEISPTVCHKLIELSKQENIFKNDIDNLINSKLINNKPSKDCFVFGLIGLQALKGFILD